MEAYEARVLSVLVEKALTTPEQYPLTLNAVVNGANQKSNRDPVLNLSDDAVSEALDGLIDKQLARKVFPGNSRVDKFCHTGTSALKVEIAQLAVLAELMMRGPQTPAELRARVARMVPVELERAAHGAARCPRAARNDRARPGRARLSCRTGRAAPVPGPASVRRSGPGRAAPAAEDPHAPTRAALAARVEAVEATVDRLERQLRTPGPEARRAARRLVDCPKHFLTMDRSYRR